MSQIMAYDASSTTLTVGGEVIKGRAYRNDLKFKRGTGFGKVAEVELRLQATSKNVPFLRERLGEKFFIDHDYVAKDGCYDYFDHVGFKAELTLVEFEYESGDGNCVPTVRFVFKDLGITMKEGKK